MKVIKQKNLPTQLPFNWTLLVVLAADHWHAPAWVWGALCVVIAVVWGLSVSVKMHETPVDIFKDGAQ